jgi:hypothetical protein
VVKRFKTARLRGKTEDVCTHSKDSWHTANQLLPPVRNGAGSALVAAQLLEAAKSINSWPTDHSPYVADTMPTHAKTPRYRSAGGLARGGSPPSAASPPTPLWRNPPTLPLLPRTFHLHTTHIAPPRPRPV